MSPGGDLAGGRECFPDEIGGRELDFRSDDVDQVMADAALGRGCRLVGADVEAAVNLDGIAADDLAPETQGQVDGYPALADGGRAEDDDDVARVRF